MLKCMNCKFDIFKFSNNNNNNNKSLFSDVSHLILIDPLVETLFDNEQWKDYWYNKLIPRLHAMQMSAAVGINRVLLLTNLLKTPITTETSDDDDLHINHRQVIEF